MCALISTGGGVSQISGSVGGTTYSRNRYGAYMRSRTIPVNPGTLRQSKVRGYLAQLTQDWSNLLTPTQRDQWSAYAANVPVTNRLGQTIYLSGINMFIRTNISVATANLSLIDDGPVIFTLPGADPNFSVTCSAATQQISVTYDDTLDWCDDDNGCMTLQMGLPQNEGIKFFNGPWRFADSIDGDSVAPPASPQVIPCSFTVQENQLLWVQARILRADGRLSNFFRAQTTCAA